MTAITPTSTLPLAADPAAIPPPASDDAAGNRNYWSSYNWIDAGEEWSKPWGGTESLWFNLLYPRLHPFLPARNVLEIGPGFGRITEHLRRYADHLTAVDLAPRCVDACRARFARHSSVRSVVNDGASLAMIPDNALDLAFSWDALVNVEQPTVRAYLVELKRTLRPGGVAFLHHSNLGMHASDLKGTEGPAMLGGRRISQSAEKFRADCAQSGLRCLIQELIPWTGASVGKGPLWTDCFSLLMRDEANPGLPPTVVQRVDWGAEVARAATIGTLYRKPAEVG